MTLRNTHSKQQHTHTTPEPLSLRLRVHPGYNSLGWTTWWLWRGARTRSHPELGRENPQRPWYCVLRHGRVGRRQVFQPRQNKHSEPYTIQPSAHTNAGWSSPVARQAHNLKVRGSNPLPATNVPITSPKPEQPLPGRGTAVRDDLTPDFHPAIARVLG